MTLDESTVQSPPQHYEQRLSNWSSFNPGEWQQDLVTIPLEIGLIAAVNEFIPSRSNSLWPFDNEKADKNAKETTYPRSDLLPYILGTSATLVGGLAFFTDHFPFYRVSIGWIHAHLLTEVATSTAKTTFQRKRPFYDKKAEQGATMAKDDKFSFFSGHASHAFAFATYSSAMLFEYSNSLLLNWTYTGFIFTAAGIIAASRVTDNAHYVSDVIVGGLVGTIISGLVFYRMQDVYTKSKTNSAFHYNISPLVFRDELEKPWYGVNLEVTF